MKLLFIEPFYGGSHKNFADGLISYSRHAIDLVTLPARFWKWRMRGAALHFIGSVRDFSRYEGIITTDMIDLTDLMALAGPSFPPCLVYFHENQLTYPPAPGETMDFQYGMTNITTALSSKSVLFNSQSHLDAFLQAVSCLMKRMPDARIGFAEKVIAKKAKVLYPGCALNCEDFDLDRKRGDGCEDGDGEVAPLVYSAEKSMVSMAGKPWVEGCNVPAEPPLIIWNHRWEFDKKPEVFFHALKQIKAAEIPFRLALLGERFTVVPEIFHGAMRDFEHEIVVAGHVADRCDYIRWLKQGDLVVSTAIQENFGISVVEAIRFGALPILPQRLSYPEIIPKGFHRDVLYSSFEGLVTMLKERLRDMEKFQGLRQVLADAMGAFSWEEMIDRYDAEFEVIFRPHRVEGQESLMRY